jgi:hypothetical protein
MDKQNKKSKKVEKGEKSDKENLWTKRKKTIRHRKEGLMKIIQYFNRTNNSH